MSEIPLIAVVDDDAAIREAVESLLRSVGFRTAVFASAEDFWYAGPLQATACLIVDVRMPRMSGPELPAGSWPWPTAPCRSSSSPPMVMKHARAGVARRRGGLSGQTLQR